MIMKFEEPKFSIEVNLVLTLKNGVWMAFKISFKETHFGEILIFFKNSPALFMVYGFIEMK